MPDENQNPVSAAASSVGSAINNAVSNATPPQGAKPGLGFNGRTLFLIGLVVLGVFAVYVLLVKHRQNQTQAANTQADQTISSDNAQAEQAAVLNGQLAQLQQSVTSGDAALSAAVAQANSNAANARTDASTATNVAKEVLANQEHPGKPARPAKPPVRRIPITTGALQPGEHLAAAGLAHH